MPQLELTFESGDESLSVRSFRVEEGPNDLFTIAITARSADPDLDLASFVGRGAGFLLVPVHGVPCMNICDHMRTSSTGRGTA